MAKLLPSMRKADPPFNCSKITKAPSNVPLVYNVFDLLFVDGKDLRKGPLSAKRKLLADILKKSASKNPAL